MTEDKIKLSPYLKEACVKLKTGNDCVHRPTEPNPYIPFEKLAKYLIMIGKSQKTAKTYLYRIASFEAELTKENLENFQDHIRYKTEYTTGKKKGQDIEILQSSRIRKNYMVVNILKHILRATGRKGMIKFLPDKLPPPVRIPKEITFKKKDIEYILNHSDPDSSLLFEFLRYSGARIGESLFMRKFWIDYLSDPTMIKVPIDISKAKKPGVLYLNKATSDKLKEYTKDMKPDDYVFKFIPLEDGTEKDYRHLEIEALFVLKKLRLYAPPHLKDVSLHWYRHTFCLELHKSGCGLVELQKIMRHSSPDVTIGYINPDIQVLKDTYKRTFK